MTIRAALILSLLFFLSSRPLNGQNYTMDGSPITDCTGTFFDPGGSAGNYVDNQNLSTTICSNGASGTHIRLSFSGADLAPGDALCFYDGVNLSAPLLACHTDYNPGQPFLIQATAANTSGCLTVSFISDGSGIGAGWSAAISCVPSCQPILADLVSTTPAVTPLDTGWIDICPGDRVFFEGMGIYPQNNLIYPQSDFTTVFEWNFGDGAISYGPQTSHRFDQPGGYYVQLTLVDEQGCHNTNLINQRVRVAPRPGFQLQSVLPATLCAGDTLALSATTSGSTNADLAVQPNVSSFLLEGSRSDSLALPDGTGIPYQTSVFFTEFSPGQVLVDPNDLESICVNMEHSWARDVEIRLTCPNGQSIILHDHPGNTGSQVFLGEPNDNDNVFPIPGIGYDYCWINNAPNPTWLEYANTSLGGAGTLPSGAYSSYEPISDLVGCPLNGEWTITVTDWWPIDNGFIFNWSLKFADHLYPNIETFSPSVLSWEWNNHPSILLNTPDAITASPSNAGIAGYRFTVHDAFGCSWDTLLTVGVLPPTHPDCHSCAQAHVLRDTILCAGEMVSFQAGALIDLPQEIQFESYPDYPLGNGNHPPSNPYYAPLNVNSLGYPLITNPAQQISSVCMDIETDYCSDLTIFLQAPSGQLLELSSGNGGSGDNYKVTCFSPSATTSIIGQAAPFNGTYRPEGNWNSLLGAAVNGNWSLRISDGFAPGQYGKVNWWSIKFKVNNSIAYSWSNSTSLTCSNCPNPVATPGQSTTYTVTAADVFGCQQKDSAHVELRTVFPAPTGLTVVANGGGTLIWAWDALPGALGYEVSIDGGAWQPANGNLMHTVTGLSIGQQVTIELRAVSPGCAPEVATDQIVHGNCTMVAQVDAVLPVICAGDSTGSAIISLTGGDAPFQFFVNYWPGGFPDGNLIQILPAGDHQVIVRDFAGCVDTVYFTITEPDSILVQTTTQEVDCPGLDTGVASATATGGNGNLSFAWAPCSGGAATAGPIVTNLMAGCYQVTVTDDNNCRQTASVTIQEPPPFIFMSNQTPVSCFGGNNGTASIQVSGGTMPYSYAWDNSQTGATANGFTAGFHFVTITDSRNCKVATIVQVTQPPQLLVSSTDTQPVSCFGGNNGSATVVMTGGVPPYSYQWDNGQSTATAQNIAAGPHTVTISDANNCSTQLVLTVSEPFELLADFSVVVDEPCAGECQGSATVAPVGGTAPYDFMWSDPNVTPGVQTATGLCPGMYSVTVQDAHGCTVSLSEAIQAAIPIQTVFSTTTPACAGQPTGSASATVSGGVGPYTYFWETGSTSANLSQVLCGEHRLTITDALGCIQVDTALISCPDPVVFGPFSVETVKCFGAANGSATAQVSGGQSPYTFIWSDPNNQTTQQAQSLSAGAYTVTATDANLCSATATVSVGEPSLLDAQLTITNIQCKNTATGALSAQAAGGTGPYQFNWSIGTTGDHIDNLPAATYTVTVTDANGCSTIRTATVTQPAQGIQLTLTELQSACYGASNGSVSAVAAGGVSPYVFSWNNGQSAAQLDSLSPGMYTVTVSDQSTCTAVQTVEVHELERVVVNVAFVPPTCFGLPDGKAGVNLITGGTGMSDTSKYHFYWSVPGAPDAAQLNNLFGDATYQITATDFQGCSATYSFYVPQPPAMVVESMEEQVRCFGGLDGAIHILSVANSNQPVSYQWSNTGTGAEITGLGVGTYTVTVTDALDCKVKKTFEITEPEQLQLEFEQEPLRCAADSNGVITVAVNGGTPDFLYTWDNGATGAELTQLPAGQYKVTVTDANGCTIEGMQHIAQPDSLLLAVTWIMPECFGALNGRIILNGSGGQAPYRYSLNGSDFSGINTYIALGAGVYTAQVRDGNGCIASVTDTLDQPPAIEILLPQDTTIVLGDSLLIHADVSNTAGMPLFSWSSAYVDTFTCLDTAFCETIRIQPPLNNIYRLTVTDENGCTARAEVKIGVLKPHGIYVPTGFSPNGDQINDLLVVHGLSKQVARILTFRVYDRWGELLFEDRDFQVNDLNRGWDGRFRDQLCDPGVYIWVLEAEYLDGFTEVKKGDTTLIR